MRHQEARILPPLARGQPPWLPARAKRPPRVYADDEAAIPLHYVAVVGINDRLCRRRSGNPLQARRQRNLPAPPPLHQQRDERDGRELHGRAR